MKLLDLFCGAGGASMGYHRAGFEVVGVDIKPQPHYPFEFHQADALTYPLDGFDVIHASPPCQLYSRRNTAGRQYPDLVGSIRSRMNGHRHVIENVVGAPLRTSMMLCGTMFGLMVLRHRLFEISPEPTPKLFDISCDHKGNAGHDLRRARYLTVVGHAFPADQARTAMGVDWMTRDELSQAIPPAYTEHIGKALLTS
jgi:DNA (cytosine-5)-methyltransferase 1